MRGQGQNLGGAEFWDGEAMAKFCFANELKYGFY